LQGAIKSAIIDNRINIPRGVIRN